MEPDEHLILKYLQGTLSQAERETFESWLNQSDEHRKRINDFRGFWKASAGEERNIDFQTEQEWTKLQASLSREMDTESVVDLNPKSYALRFAAAIAFLVVSYFVLQMVVFRSDDIAHETADQTLHVVLPDGSEVWLNAESRLSYSDDFTDSRDLKLEGEGFFEVKSFDGKSFVIHADEIQIQVLGTSFNVKAYDEEMQAEVFVVTGKVTFSTADRNNSIVLAPGMNGIFNKKDGTMVHETEADRNIVAWKEKRLVFRKTPLGEVAKTLERYFKTDIRIKNEKLLICRFTSEFNDPTLQEVIEALSVALDLKVEYQSNSYALDGEGCHTN